MSGKCYADCPLPKGGRETWGFTFFSTQRPADISVPSRHMWCRGLPYPLKSERALTSVSVGTGLATRVAEKPVAEGLARGVALSYEKTEVRVPASRAERRWTCHVSPLGRLGMTDEKAVCRRWGPHHFWLGACCPQDPLRKAETYIPPPPLNSIRAGGPGGSMPLLSDFLTGVALSEILTKRLVLV